MLSDEDEVRETQVTAEPSKRNTVDTQEKRVTSATDDYQMKRASEVSEQVVPKPVTPPKIHQAAVPTTKPEKKKPANRGDSYDSFIDGSDYDEEGEEVSPPQVNITKVQPMQEKKEVQPPTHNDEERSVRVFSEFEQEPRHQRNKTIENSSVSGFGKHMDEDYTERSVRLGDETTVMEDTTPENA